MPSDIVQVIDRAVAVLTERAFVARGEAEDLVAIYDDETQAAERQAFAVVCDADMAQLRALRDRIVEDRKAFLELGRASAVFSDSTGFTITLTDKVKARDSVATERALLAFCREVGT